MNPDDVGDVIAAVDTAELVESGVERPIGQRMITGVRWSLLDQTVQQVLRMVVNVVLARLVAPRSFGLLAMALVVTQISMFVANAGLGSALVHRERLEKRHVDVAFTFTSLLGAALALLVVVLARPIATFFHQDDLRPVLLALSAVFFVKGVHAVPLDLLRRALRFDRTALVATLGTVSASIVGITCAVLGAGVWALVAYSLTEAVVAAAAALFFAAQLGVWSPGLSTDREALRELASFGAFVTASRFLGYGVGNFDNLIVGKVLGAEPLGWYGLAYRVVLFPIQRVADAVALVTFPAFARVQADMPRMRRMYLQSIEAVALLCFPATVGVAVAGGPLIRTVFGDHWVPAIATMEILALGGPKLALTRLNSSVFQAVGRPKWDFQVGVFDFVLFVTGFLIGVQFGVAGVASGFAIAAYTALPVDLTVCAKALGVRTLDILGAVSRVAVATAALAAAGLAVRVSVHAWGPPAQLAGIIAASALAYFATLSVIARGLVKNTAMRFIRR